MAPFVHLYEYLTYGYEQRINAFIKLGGFLKLFKTDNFDYTGDDSIIKKHIDSFNELIKTSHLHNPWFTEDNVRNAIYSLSLSLSKENILNRIEKYAEEIKNNKNTKEIGVVMAGNIPIVGFHDFLCILI